MPEPFEVAQHAASQRAAEEARRSALVRGEHIWLRVDYIGGVRWLPGILLGWGHGADGWRGRVQVVMLTWDQRAGEWSSRSWEEWAVGERIVSAGTVPPDGSDVWRA
jgi:hypothetical protein